MKSPLTNRTFSDGPPVRITLQFEALHLARASLSFSKQFSCSIEGDAGQLETLIAFLESYGKKRPMAIDLDLDRLTPFRKKALTALQKVPFGEVVTYGNLAAKMNAPKAARAVGMACHHNPYPLFIPCHRVIASTGLGGFACGSEMKKILLEFECRRN